MIPNTNSQKSYYSRQKCNCKSKKTFHYPPENNTEDTPGREILVPVDVDVDSLLFRYDPDLTPTRTENLTDRIYYFLSLILTTNDNYKLLKGGYHRICSTKSKDIIGNKDLYLIIELLSDSNDPIVESNNSYHTSNTGKNNGFCKGYRLVPKYNTGNTRKVRLSEKFSNKIERHSVDVDNLEIIQTYEFLTHQLSSYNITIDDRVWESIRFAGLELLKRVEDENPFQTNMIYNNIGRWIYYVNKINQNNLWTSISGKNHRLNSNITNLSRELRPFLRVNGTPLGIIDITSSQPYILSSLMNVNFFNDTSVGYNLYSVYPELYEMLVDKGYIKQNVSYSSGTTINYTSSISGSTTMLLYKEISTPTSPPFMWCKFSTSEIESIHRYQSSPFESDFYIDVLKSYTEITGEVLCESPDNERQKLKESMMFVLFDDNFNHRNHNNYIQMFGCVYPGVDKWIGEVHRIIGKSRFSYLLQRCESYLMLNVVAREFHQKNPAVPIFSIHDALLTFDDYIPELSGMTLGRFKEIIGIDVGVKVKPSPERPRISLVEIDEIWKEIEPIKTKKRFENVAGSVLKSNVDCGTEFLKFPD